MLGTSEAEDWSGVVSELSVPCSKGARPKAVVLGLLWSSGL